MVPCGTLSRRGSTYQRENFERANPTDDSHHATQFAVLKAHAGAGKSVTIRRIAWDAAKVYGRVVLYVNNPSGLSLHAFEELISLTNQTIYVFIDDLTELVEEAERLIQQARRKKWHLVIIAAARVNEWNTRCKSLHSLVDEEYDLKYLSPTEIDSSLPSLSSISASDT